MNRSNTHALRVSPSVGERDPAAIVRRIVDTIRSDAAIPARKEAAQALRSLRDGLRGIGTRAFRAGCCIAGWPVDLVCVEAALIVQVDDAGPSGYGARLAGVLAACGYRVIRLRSDDVLQRPEEALAEILLHLPVD